VMVFALYFLLTRKKACCGRSYAALIDTA
jgi:hypothetical protein